jgi:hypothetical protein
LELGAACSDGTVCTSNDACNNGQCVGVAACPETQCNTTTCTQFEGKPKCVVDPHGAGVACGEGGRCSTTQTCETDFCELSITVAAVPALVANEVLELPFEVTFTNGVKWARLHSSGSKETTLQLKFNNKYYTYRHNLSVGRYSGTYFSGEYPYGFVFGSEYVPAGLVPAGQWLLQIQATKNLKGTGFLDPTTVTFGYQCPTP